MISAEVGEVKELSREIRACGAEAEIPWVAERS